MTSNTVASLTSENGFNNLDGIRSSLLLHKYSPFSNLGCHILGGNYNSEDAMNYLVPILKVRVIFLNDIVHLVNILSSFLNSVVGVKIPKLNEYLRHRNREQFIHSPR